MKANSNAQATLNVFVGNNQLLGTMVNQGGGSYTFQQPYQAGTPASVNAVSNLGGKTGQGVFLGAFSLAVGLLNAACMT